MSKFQRTACLWVITFFLASPLSAAPWSIFYPHPEPKPISASEPTPAWIKSGVGDDGYIRVMAEPSLSSGCQRLGDAGLLGVINKESVRLIITLIITGIEGPFNGKEVPIATLSSNRPGECVLINNPQINIVPLTRLRSINPGDFEIVKFELRVRTVSESDFNLINATQASLGLVSLFATGGAANTVAALSSWAVKPMFENAEKFFEEQAKSTTPGQSSYPSTFSDLRKSVRRIDFPIYLGSYWLGNPGDNLNDFQKSIKEDTPRALTVSVRLFFTRSAFPLQLLEASQLPDARDIKNSQILKYPNQPNAANLLQILAGNDPEQPSFLQAMATATSENIQIQCKRALELLEAQGLNKMDRVIALKAFIDTAKKNSGWYTPSFLSKCFADGFYSEFSLLKTIYGNTPPPPPVDRDAVNPITGEPADIERHKKWMASGVPFLYKFQNAILATENREASLYRLSGGTDIDLQFYKGEAPWAALPETGAHANISRLASKKIIAAGCFGYALDEENPSVNMGNLLLRDDTGATWVARVFVKRNNEEVTLKTVEIAQYQEDWKLYYEPIFENKLFPSPLSSQCAKVRKNN
ncbi:hypothetical protein CLU95_0583 [Variovorax sp. 54]|uniref:hypothetical protein n=1 Tax=Variovorax sp. 54 TaxID=2035212 RepID=UPI000C471065|nr:hypothetical protein [Variovorax sp. 54]PIF73491.1 hypothetical protein CLU95_0583 [Variovorax sp. 54]